jgi:endo-1,3-1,4-beta-glycanase ExoK
VAPRPGFYDNLSSYNTTIWRKADWTSPGNCQNTVQNITHNGGVMKLELNDTPAGGYDYSCAEYQTKAEYGYGIYSARIKAASRSGVVTGFFVYHGDHWGAPDHNEIDMEILGNAPTKVHLNYFTNGIGVNGEHEQDIDLSPVISGFDASSDYHTYTFEWRNNRISWSVDGISVRTATVSIPTIPGKISVNLWTPNYADWTTPGAFTYTPPGTPIHSRVDMIQFTP